MTTRLAGLVYALCTIWLVLLPAGALYLLIDLERFASIAATNLGQPIQWYTVTDPQWYGLWVSTAMYAAIGYAAVFYLRRAFGSFARGAWFDADNSRSLRRFALLLIAQGLAKPVHFAVSSVLLSINHPPGEKVLAVSLGSGEVILIATGLIMWVLADLLVEGMKADAENRQFV